jgi:hypothetical protein
MNPILQKIIRKATLLVLISSIVSCVVADKHFAAGVVLSGMLLIGSFMFGNILTASALGGEDADGDPSPGAPMNIPLLILFKFLIVGGGAYALLSTFPPLSIVLGGGMLVLAISFDAMQQLKTTTGEFNGI